MKSISYSVFLYFFVCVGAVVVGAFTWSNLTSKYAHHFFFTKNTFAAFTAANILVLAPFITQYYGYAKFFPHLLIASKIIGVVIYIGFAMYNVYSTSILMGLCGTTFQFLIFWALFPLFLGLIILRLALNLLNGVFEGFISPDENDSWPHATDELDDVVEEQLRIKKEIDQNFYQGF
jgi:hypothetical protein